MNLSLLPLLCLGLIASLLSGCAGWVETERKVFHNMFSKDTDRSFAVVPGDTAKRDNLEFNHHAARTSIYLKDLGYRMIKPGETPDLMVFLDYGIAPLSTHQFRRYLSIAIFDQKKKKRGYEPPHLPRGSLQRRHQPQHRQDYPHPNRHPHARLPR